MADQICYAILCVFSYVAAGQNKSSDGPVRTTTRPVAPERSVGSAGRGQTASIGQKQQASGILAATSESHQS